MYSIQSVLKIIDENRIIDIPQYLRYAASPSLITMEFEKVQKIYDEIMLMGETTEAQKEAIEFNAWVKRMDVTVKRASEYIHSRATKGRISSMLDKMTIMRAEVVTSLLGVKP